MTRVPSPEIGASLRDPAGRLFAIDSRLYRIVTDEAAAVAVHRTLASPTWAAALAEGRVVASRPLQEGEVAALQARVPDALCRAVAVFEHPRVRFPSYPHEWTPTMLHAAGGLTLRLARGLLAEGLGLKDATPSNVMFEGTRPVFLDLLSVESRDPGDPAWRPYAQFTRSFLLPLLAQRELGTSLADVFVNRRDGLEPGEVYRSTSVLGRLKPGFLGLVSIPVWLESRAGGQGEKLYQVRREKDPAKARFVLQALLRGLEKRLASLSPRVTDSAWTLYQASSYSTEQREQKRRFVEAALRRQRPPRVLDLGCNTGEYSELAAEAGSAVVAIDRDAASVDALCRRAAAAGHDILPLVVDLSRPSPALGWANRECLSFLDRSAGAFDLVLALALVHHLLVGEGIPLVQVVEALHHPSRGRVIVEFVAPADPMFQRLLRGRGDLHRGLDATAFEAALRQRFEVVESETLPGGTRSLYLLESRDASVR